MNSVLSTQGILQLFLKYTFLFDLLLAATPRKDERHFVSFLPGLTLTYPCGMQFISEHFQMYHIQRGLHVTVHSHFPTYKVYKRWSNRGATRGIWTSCTSAAYMSLLKKGHNNDRTTNIHFTLLWTQGGLQTAKLRNQCPRDAVQGLWWAVPAWLCCALLAQCFQKDSQHPSYPKSIPPHNSEDSCSLLTQIFPARKCLVFRLSLPTCCTEAQTSALVSRKREKTLSRRC